MKKVYVIFPALAMLIFFGFWWNFSDKFEAKKAAIVAAQKIEKQQKLEQDARDREKAIMDALASQAVRKAEREANEAKKQKDREDRQTAKEESLKAGDPMGLSTTKPSTKPLDLLFKWSWGMQDGVSSPATVRPSSI